MNEIHMLYKMAMFIIIIYVVNFFFNVKSINNFPNQGCEKEVAESSEEQKAESIMRFSWALVHSRQPDDVQRGIAMLEGAAKWIHVLLICYA